MVIVDTPAKILVNSPKTLQPSQFSPVFNAFVMTKDKKIQILPVSEGSQWKLQAYLGYIIK